MKAIWLVENVFWVCLLLKVFANSKVLGYPQRESFTFFIIKRCSLGKILLVIILLYYSIISILSLPQMWRRCWRSPQEDSSEEEWGWSWGTGGIYDNLG